MGHSSSPLADVFAEMRHARDKHGDNYMGNLPPDDPHSDAQLREIFEDVVALGREAKFLLEEHGFRSPMLVFLEEHGEMAADMLAGHDETHERSQCAAMMLASLGIDPDRMEVSE